MLIFSHGLRSAIYDPIALHGQVGFHPDEHRALWAVKTWGFIDVFRRHNALSGQYTFWDYRIRNAVKNGAGWRIDHIWATRPAADGICEYMLPLISLAERAWELASLRVLGFTRHEVSTLLLGELAFEITLAIPLGLWLGKLLSQLIIALMPTQR